MRPFTQVKGPYAVIPNENIDTDQIIPARFLKTTEREGLGRYAFYDWRYGPKGESNSDFILNQGTYEILVAGENFGCGSSREHAAWALLDAGIRVVISTSIADIFKSNALRNGLLVCQVSRAFHQYLVNARDQGLEVDLPRQRLLVPNGKHINFELDPFAKRCLLKGFDQMDALMDYLNQVEEYEEQH